jgi:hypothetical protein
VPATLPLMTIGVIAVPEQMVCEPGVATAFGVGFTVMVTVTGGPLHPLAVGVIVNTTFCGVLVVLVSVPLILPLPLAAIPVTFTLLSLVQLNTVPATGPTSTTGVIAVPEQMVCAPRLDPHPLIPGTVSVPIFGQTAKLLNPLMQPDATTAPPHLTSQRTELSLNVPLASIKNVNGPPAEVTSADGVGGGLNP